MEMACPGLFPAYQMLPVPLASQQGALPGYAGCGPSTGRTSPLLLTMALRAIRSQDERAMIFQRHRDWLHTIGRESDGSGHANRMRVANQASEIIGTVVDDGSEGITELPPPGVPRGAAIAAGWQRAYEVERSRARRIQFEHKHLVAGCVIRAGEQENIVV